MDSNLDPNEDRQFITVRAPAQLPPSTSGGPAANNADTEMERENTDVANTEEMEIEIPGAPLSPESLYMELVELEGHILDARIGLLRVHAYPAAHTKLIVDQAVGPGGDDAEGYRSFLDAQLISLKDMICGMNNLVRELESRVRTAVLGYTLGRLENAYTAEPAGNKEWPPSPPDTPAQPEEFFGSSSRQAARRSTVLESAASSGAEPESISKRLSALTPGRHSRESTPPLLTGGSTPPRLEDQDEPSSPPPAVPPRSPRRASVETAQAIKREIERLGSTASEGEGEILMPYTHEGPPVRWKVQDIQEHPTHPQRLARRLSHKISNSVRTLQARFADDSGPGASAAGANPQPGSSHPLAQDPRPQAPQDPKGKQPAVASQSGTATGPQLIPRNTLRAPQRRQPALASGSGAATRSQPIAENVPQAPQAPQGNQPALASRSVSATGSQPIAENVPQAPQAPQAVRAPQAAQALQAPQQPDEGPLNKPEPAAAGPAPENVLPKRGRYNMIMRGIQPQIDQGKKLVKKLKTKCKKRWPWKKNHGGDGNGEDDADGESDHDDAAGPAGGGNGGDDGSNGVDENPRNAGDDAAGENKGKTPSLCSQCICLGYMDRTCLCEVCVSERKNRGGNKGVAANSSGEGDGNNGVDKNHGNGESNAAGGSNVVAGGINAAGWRNAVARVRIAAGGSNVAARNNVAGGSNTAGGSSIAGGSKAVAGGSNTTGGTKVVAVGSNTAGGSNVVAAGNNSRSLPQCRAASLGYQCLCQICTSKRTGNRLR
ncbi:hypothetical protein B0T16DRAFT_460595 [Cercophora newfieldiana]|uniref:Uncharacterized protein n=1 Tax=Cercophora newfieldiana TaxID=92897 RepID=A0AA39Y209_9PEZI|nr:hypothetical protein B0T16DRAFT_460595 [Cercophora newfieldiana]